MTEKLDSLPLSSAETRVDLGEDLLEKTAMVPGLTASQSRKTQPVPNPLEIPAGESGSIEDLLHSAKILVDEDLVADAKKILHQILIINAGNKSALGALEGIQKEEEKYLFREEAARNRVPQGKVENQIFDPEELMRKLDQDLGLGIFEHGFQTALASDLAFFKSREELESFSLQLEKELAGAAIQDWIDLGIAFLEIDFYQIAVRLFTGACRKTDCEIKGEHSISATSLLALTLIQLGKPFEAIAKLQPTLRNVEIETSKKLEVYYLMGCIYESLKKHDLALHFYNQVMGIDPRYRDVKFRLPNRK